MSDLEGKPRDGGAAARAPIAASGGERHYYWKRRSRASTDATHGHGAALLATTSELNFVALDVRESFERLTPAQQLRLYHTTRAVCEAQKIAFLQASAESPLILLLFQELFCSPEEDASPGELILELQKTCFTNGLGDAIADFLKYVALFYHNFGNYDLLTGEKIIPDIKSFEFENIVRSSRAFAQRRGLRLKRAMDACLDAIYRPAVATSQTSAPSTAEKEPIVVPINENQSYPFYGRGVSYLDIVRVDRELSKHDILRINTRITKEVDRKKTQRATFHVYQTSLAGAKTKHGAGQDGSDAPSKVFLASNHDEIQVQTLDHNYYLSKIMKHLLQAAQVDSVSVSDSVSKGHFKGLVDKTLALWSNPTKETWTDAHQFWLEKTSSRDDTDFLFSYSLAPPHRDPIGSRGTFEAFLTVSNNYYQRITDRILVANGVLEKIMLPTLPFNQKMIDFREQLNKSRVACVDLVSFSGCGGIMPLTPRLRRDISFRSEDRILFIVNCAESYWDGHMTAEKKLLLDAFFSPDDVRTVQEQWARILYMRFIFEDVLAPCTAFILREGDDVTEIALLPAELYIDTSDDEDECIVVEDASDCEDYQDSEQPTTPLLDQERLWRESSFARYPTQTYRRENDSYSSRFHGQLGVALEHCRAILTGLLLAIDDGVRQAVFRETSSADEITVRDESQEDPRMREAALAYVLMLGRDGLLALPFFSTQQFRWEDEKMLARFMVLQMLLSEAAAPSSPPQEYWNDAVVRIQATVTYKKRDLTDIALGVEEEQVTALKIVVNTTAVDAHNGRKLSWRHRLKIYARTWLQEIQWIQMTGDVEGGQQLYQRFARVSDESLRYRNFLMYTLGDPDAKRREDDIKSGGRGGGSNVPNARASMNSAIPTEPTPVLPQPSMVVRQNLLAIRNASCFSRDTIWISPFLRSASETSVSRSDDQRDEGINLAGARLVQASNNLTQDDPDQGELDGSKSGTVDQATHTNNSGQELECTSVSVELRVFPADLTFAVESAVLNVGVISDEEAAQGLGVVKGDRVADQAR